MNRLDKLKSIFDTKTFSAMYRWSKPVHGAIVIICLTGVIASLLSLGATLVTKGMIDGATGSDMNGLIRNAAMLVGIMAAERVMGVCTASVRMRANARLQKEMQRMVTGELLGKEYASLKSFHSGELVNRVFSDVAVVKNGVMNILPSLLRMAVSFVGAAAILISMDWRFMPVLIIVGIVGTLLMVLFREPMKRRHKRMQAAEDALHASTQETLENIRVVKASSGEERAMREMDMSRENLSGEQIRAGRLSIMINSGMGTVFNLSWLICNIWGCVRIAHGLMTYGSLAALISLVGRIQGPIANAMTLVSQIYGVTASAERLMDVVGLPDEARPAPVADFDRIELNNVSFQYDDGQEDVLIGVSAVIEKGDFAALTGISGGGKTSLFQLLLGIYRPTGGEVVFVSEDGRHPASRGTRGLFAYVPQGNTLFSGTLRDNLTRFSGDMPDEEIIRAAKAACIDDLIDDIGMDAVLGERGIGLSEGQAQRVAVARALLSRAEILLLDEATSALDAETEARLLDNISKMRGKTVIIVTHRRAALEICDYQLRIENGRMMKVPKDME